jgi:glycosyltransferase involved in cell wall biosynthesis
LTILHINTYDVGGGAGNLAFSIVHSADGNKKFYLVKEKHSHSEKVIALPRNLIDYSFQFFDKFMWRFSRQTLKDVLMLNERFNFTYKKISRLPEYKEADIIHFHNLHGSYFDFEAIEKIAAEKKIVWTMHDMWTMTGGEAHTIGGQNFVEGKPERNGKTIYAVNRPLVDRRQFYLGKKKSLYLEHSKSIFFVACSQWIAENFRKAYVFNPNVNLSLIYNGIETGFYQNLNQRTWSTPRLLFFNSSSPWKGAEIFKNILPLIKGSFELVLVGKKIEGASVLKHYETVTDKKELLSLYNQVDILVFPSIAETFPLMTLEAMSCGVTVIASNAGGIPEQVTDDTGYVFQNGDENGLLEKIETAISDISLCRKKGMMAAASVRAKFDIYTMIGNYTALYKQVFQSN